MGKLILFSIAFLVLSATASANTVFNLWGVDCTTSNICSLNITATGYNGLFTTAANSLSLTSTQLPNGSYLYTATSNSLGRISFGSVSWNGVINVYYVNSTVQNAIISAVQTFIGTNNVVFSNSTPLAFISNSLTQAQVTSIISAMNTAKTFYPALANYLTFSNQTLTLKYGAVADAGTYLLPGNTAQYFTYSKKTGFPSVFNVVVVKNQSKPNIHISSPNIASVDINEINSTPVFKIPVINGCAGLTSRFGPCVTTVPVTVTFSDRLISGNKADYHLKIAYIGNGTVIYSANIVANNFTQASSFNIPVASSGVVLDLAVNNTATYSPSDPAPSTVPAGVIGYKDITFKSSNALKSNYIVNFTENTVNDNVYYYNAISGDLRNAAVYYTNGTGAYTWIQGTSNGILATSVNSAFGASRIDAFYYTRVNGNFLTGTITSNDLFLMWYGNTITSSNTIMSTNTGIIGEGPTFNGFYSSLDNIGYVFGQKSPYLGASYLGGIGDDFRGIALANTWNSVPGVTINNGASFATNGGATVGIANNTGMTTPSILKVFLTALSGSGLSGEALCYDTQNDLNGAGNPCGANAGYANMFPSSPGFTSNSLYHVNAYTALGGYTAAAASIPQIYNLSWATTGNELASVSTGGKFKSADTTTPLGGNAVYADLSGGSGGASWSFSTQWILSYPYVGGGVPPSASLGAFTATVPVVSVASTSNTVIDRTQAEQLTITLSPATTAPYTYNFLVTNAVTSNIIFATQISNSLTSNSVSFTLPNEANAIGKLTFTANVVDSTSQPSAIVTNTFGANALPSFPLISTNTIADSTQLQTLKGTESGGAGPFTINFFNATTGALSVFNTVSSVALGGTASNSFITKSPVANNVFSWNVVITDTGTTSFFITNSVTNTFAVNTLPSATISFSNTIVDSGQYETFTTVGSGGSGLFTVNFFNATAGTLAVYNTLINVAVGATSTNTELTSCTLQNQANSWNIIYTDIGTTSPFIVNSVTKSIGVNAILASTTNSVSNTLNDQGQMQTLKYVISGGSAPFFFNLMVSNTLNGNIIGTNVIGSTTSATNTLTLVMPTDQNAIGKVTYTFNVVDSATTPTNFLTTNSGTGYAAPSVFTRWTPDNAITLGTTGTFKVSILSGTGTFSTNILLNLQSQTLSASTANTATLTYTPAVAGTFKFTEATNDSGTTNPFALATVANSLVVSAGTQSGGGGGGAGAPFSYNPNPILVNQSLVIIQPTLKPPANPTVLALIHVFWCISNTTYSGVSCAGFQFQQVNIGIGYINFFIGIAELVTVALLVVAYYEKTHKGKDWVYYLVAAGVMGLLFAFSFATLYLGYVS